MCRLCIGPLPATAIAAALILSGCATGRPSLLADKSDGGSSGEESPGAEPASPTPGRPALPNNPVGPTRPGSLPHAPVLAVSGNVVLPVYSVRPTAVTASVNLPVSGGINARVSALSAVDVNARVNLTGPSKVVVVAGPARASVTLADGVGIKARVGGGKSGPALLSLNAGLNAPSVLSGARTTGPSALQLNAGAAVPAAAVSVAASGAVAANSGATVQANVGTPLLDVDLQAAVNTQNLLSGGATGLVGGSNPIVGVRVNLNPGN
jgi:hypothetical protein